MRQLPDSGWPECYEGKYGHQCSVIHVFEGVDAEGQLYVRREWATSKWGIVDMQAPDDFTPHSWGPAYAPDGSDTLDEILTHLEEMVEKGILSPGERARSEAFYRRLLSE